MSSHSPDLERSGQVEMPGVAPPINRGGDQCVDDSNTQLMNANHDGTDFMLGLSNDRPARPSPARSDRSKRRRQESEESHDIEDEDNSHYKDLAFEQINKKEELWHLGAANDGESYDYNPMKHLNHFERVQASYHIQSNSMTPFDQSQYIQTLFNPLTIDHDHPELITVQVIYPMLSENTPEKARQIEEEDRSAARANYQSYCPQGGRLIEQTLQSRTECTYCGVEVPKGKTMYSSVVEASEPFNVCVDCNLKHYIRMQLKHQNSQHQLFEQYELQAVGTSSKGLNQ